MEDTTSLAIPEERLLALPPEEYYLAICEETDLAKLRRRDLFFQTVATLNKREKAGLLAANTHLAKRLWTQFRMGELLKEMPKNPGVRTTGKGSPMLGPPKDMATYLDLGISKMLASRTQQLVDLLGRDGLAAFIEEKGADVELTAARALATARKNDPNTPAPLPGGPYRVVYADPPWSYGNTMSDNFAEQRDHYPTLTLQQLCDMEVRQIVEDDAVLFLWATSPMLPEALQVVTAWGFDYKASFVWDKVRHCMGHYNSVRHEMLLVCVRGSCQPDERKLFDSVVTVERPEGYDEHSTKPEVFREMIDTLYTYGGKLEMFARRAVPGWEAYGNELGR